MIHEEILKLPLDEDNSADATTIGDYLHRLLLAVWTEAESFSGKRPFGDSGWDYELMIPLIKAGVVDGEVDEYDDVISADYKAADKMIREVINYIFEGKT